jgi:hypothetical protein
LSIPFCEPLQAILLRVTDMTRFILGRAEACFGSRLGSGGVLNAPLRPALDTPVGSPGLMAHVEPHEPAGSGELLRWSVCGIIVLTLHAAILLAIASHSDDSNLETGASVVMMELAPISAAPPAPLSELAPGPQQAESEQVEQVKQKTPKDQREAEQIPELPREPDPVVALQSGATVLREWTPQTQSREVPEAETTEEIHQEAAVANAPPSAVMVDCPSSRAGAGPGRAADVRRDSRPGSSRWPCNLSVTSATRRKPGASRE